MQGQTRERWMQLCEQAANEQDSEKLMALVSEISMLLDEKGQRLQGIAKNTPSSTLQEVKV